ncbi:MAG TPA: type I phosphomannose isomerase catalytic subunit [Luteolibacter sp.]|nr:type I phosphomannose isomerase catalytic subunit [Luteolibacter sp.]
MEPVTFHPLYMTRVWGGRELERVYGRKLPDADAPYGESWEIVDRENEQSVVDEGPMAGTSLHELWTSRREEIFGQAYEAHARFPVLIKILDARDDLSIQVHPRAEEATQGAEPKTEMWFIADCDPGAKLYVGLKCGVTRAAFERALADGSVADCVHAIEPRPGDSIFIPSGRLHAIGAGFLIHEIQQNSDTTYRVFDWNRPGLDGQPRQLHIGESLANIDFDDIEPGIDAPHDGVLADCPWFRTERIRLQSGASIFNPDPGKFSIVMVIDGELASAGGRRFEKGRTLLLPRGVTPLTAVAAADLLQICVP